MKIKIFFTGHETLENRGCEALLRSIIYLIKSEFNNVSFLIPSKNPKKDSLLWGKDDSVKFFYSKVPLSIRIWAKIIKLNFFKKFLILFSPPLPKTYVLAIKQSNVIFSIGGDNYTDEGQFPLWIYKADKTAIKLKKKTYLMFATISNFKNLAYHETLQKHFKKFEQIIVREKGSYDRLKNNYKINNALITADPTFFLKKKKCSFYDKFFINKEKPNPIFVGINLSALINRLDKKHNLEKSIHELIRNKPEYNFILLPHVFEKKNNDLIYLKKFYDKIKCYHPNVFLIDRELSSQELKYIIGRLNIFIGSRTHSALASFSQEIPTISIAYSDKGFDIARSMYGSDKYTLDYKKITSYDLIEIFEEMLIKEKLIRSRLKTKNKEIKKELKLVIKNLFKDSTN